MASLSIHSINARDNVALEVARGYFNLTPERVLLEIRTMLAQVNEVLAAKGITYSELKSGLVPSISRQEAAFVFDSLQIADGWYGRKVYEQILPLFGRKSTHSVLAGDFLGYSVDQHDLRKELLQNLRGANPFEYRNSAQFFIVYVNNLSPSMVAGWHDRLSSYTPYVGYVDMTFSSLLKVLFSTMLGSDFLLHRGIAIVGHEDDRDNTEDVDPAMHPFEESGLRFRSLQSYLFEVFLSYKIERPVLPGFETDTEFSVNAISPTTTQFVGVEVRLDASKLGYLLAKKSGSLKRLGLLEASCDEIEGIIRKKLTSNYIYNLTHDEDYDTFKFNIIIEVKSRTSIDRHRVLVALKYLPSESSVRVITLY